jgi:uncharacterized protein involved in propanediol utilization
MPEGIGVAGRHHGELLQGAVRRNGELVRCLITLPIAGVGSSARYRAEPVPLSVSPPFKLKSRRALELTLQFLGEPASGLLDVQCAVATGLGLGSSSCDVVATIRAVCSAYGRLLDPRDIARLAAEAEGASDPLMFDEMVLFAQRQGRVLKSLGPWVPPFTVLSIDTDLGAGGIDTLDFALPEYTDAEVAAFEGLVDRARAAFKAQDAIAIAKISTESAALNQRFLPMRCFPEILELAAEYGALGVQISHSGTLAGVLFDADSKVQEAIEVMERVRALGLRPVGTFRAQLGN